jgi:hypothetical protein
VARYQRKAITESFFGVPDVPAHGAGENQRDECMDLGAGAAWMPALAVVQHEIDVLIRAILELLPVVKLGGLRAEGAFEVEFLFDSHV